MGSKDTRTCTLELVCPTLLLHDNATTTTDFGVSAVNTNLTATSTETRATLYTASATAWPRPTFQQASARRTVLSCARFLLR